LQIVAHFNPLTYQVDALRVLLLPGYSLTPHLGLRIDFMVLTLTFAGMVAISARLYPTIVR